MEINNDFAYSTHQPLIKAALELFDPSFILELGIGISSTPLFKNRNYLGIENDANWIEYIKEEIGEMNILFHDLKKINIITYLNQINGIQTLEIFNYYNGIILPSSDVKPKLLFVDNYPSCRTIAINALKNKFDVIIFHDCEPGKFNYYHLIDITGFNVYWLKTSKNWTGIMTKKNFNDLAGMVNNYILIYKKEHPEMAMMEFSDIYNQIIGI